MDEKQIFEHIEELVNEEHALMQRATTEEGGLTEGEQARMHQLEVGLDQCWDLLRQRRARKHAGLDPDEARARDADTVERYLQ
ncbi:MAG: DUF2630 family protein [Ktedonobacteraceae bacterium]|nr:DUF2630 family protein [Ktedonobacteraceae bacterium]MBO0792294.1 DUF2630 family protein [Ktedonobacteraceae bacterium]